MTQPPEQDTGAGSDLRADAAHAGHIARASLDHEGRRERRKARARRGALWLACVALVLGVAGAGLSLTLPGRSFEAPGWIETRVEARLQQLLPQHDLRVQRMRVAFEDDWRPRIGLEDVILDDAQGQTRLSLSDIDLGVSISSALKGQVQARDLHVAGVVVAVSRARDGTLDFSFGQSGTTRAQFSDLPSALRAATSVFGNPRLGALERVRLDGLTVRFDDARAGRNWTVDGGRVTLEREGDAVALDGSFAVLGGRSYAATLDAELRTTLGAGGADFALDVRDFAAQDLAAQSPALAWLDVLRASISGTLSGAITEDGTLAPLSASLDLGEGALQPTEATKPIPFRTARTAFTFYPQDARIAFDALDIDSPWVSLGGSGQVLLGDMARGLPDSYTGQLRLTRISGNPADLFSEARAFEGAELDLKVTLEPFELTLGQALVSTGDAPLLATGRVAAGPDGWVYGVNAHTEALGSARVMELWPAGYKTKTRDWVAANLAEARLRDVQFAMRHDGVADRPEVYLGFGFDGARVRVLKALPELTGAAGQFELYRNRLSIRAERGGITAPQGGRVDVAGTEFILPDLTQRPNPAEVRLKGDGPVTAVLSLLDQKPFQFLTKSGQPVTLAKTGNVRFDGSLALPLKQKVAVNEVLFDVAGTATGVVSDTLVKGRTLEAPSLAISADNGGLRIAGAGTLSGVPFDGAWRQPFGKPGTPGEVTARVTLSDAALRAFGVTLPKGSLRGRGSGDLSVTLARGAPPLFDLKSALSGIGLSIPQIGWSLGEKTTGSFRVRGTLSQPVKISGMSLDAPGLKADGTIDLTPSGAFSAARLSRVVAGRWFDGAVTLTSRGKGATPAISVSGGRVDMRSAPFGQGGGSAGGGGGAAPLTLDLNRLTVADSIRLEPFKGSFTMGSALEGTFNARVNGAAAISGKVGPSRDGTGFEIRSQDAGRTLAAAGLLKQAAGGSLRLRMKPVRGRAGHYDGDLKIENTRLRDAPSMAALLSAISVVGLIEQMGGEGIFFTDVEADFRLAPDRVTVTKSSAIGPSLGISMDGWYRFGDKRLDMRGVVSPIYLINGIGALFSRNREGLFGFNYWLKGTTETPKVGVNPMSILTPGMFRDLFRKPPPKVK